MLYSERAVAALQVTAGLPEALCALRGVRETELGAVTDENIRMLATEIDRVCFGPLLALKKDQTWSFSTAMNSNLVKMEKAREEAKKTFELARQKAEKTMQSSSRKAWSVMDEIERSIGAMVETGSPGAPAQARDDADLPRLSKEGRDLQWALND